jgi:hypothetical protein
MSLAEKGGNIQEVLNGVTADFEVCARRAIEGLLNRPTLLSKPFRLNSQPSAEPLLGCFIKSGNDDYSLTISLGVEKDALRDLFPGEMEESMAMDAIGEMVNVIGGCFFGRPGIISRFGFLRASVPSIIDKDAFPGRDGNVSGVLLVESVRMIAELAITPNDTRSHL